jgi:hypothetical protein
VIKIHMDNMVVAKGEGDNEGNEGKGGQSNNG